MQVNLEHVHLPKLVDMEFIEWDCESGELLTGPNWDEIAPVLRLMYDHRDELPDEWLAESTSDSKAMSEHNTKSTRDTTGSAHSSPPLTEPYTFDQTATEFEVFEYHPEEDTYRAVYDADQNSPSTAIVSAVAAALNADPLGMDPLHTTVDPDALNSLINPSRFDSGDVHVTFEYSGCQVTATSYGNLEITLL